MCKGEGDSKVFYFLFSSTVSKGVTGKEGLQKVYRSMDGGRVMDRKYNSTVSGKRNPLCIHIWPLELTPTKGKTSAGSTIACHDRTCGLATASQ